MEYRYTPKDVCSMEMIFDIENNIIKNLKIIGGCPGNTVGVSRLVVGRSVDEVIVWSERNILSRSSRNSIRRI